MQGTVRIFDSCAAGTKKRGNRFSNCVQRKSRAVPPTQPPDILTFDGYSAGQEIPSACSTVHKRTVLSHLNPVYIVFL
jgi:hypothetical protein